jgi:hypothetical protein
MGKIEFANHRKPTTLASKTCPILSNIPYH